jgi:WD40 repeat protein
MAMNFQQLKVTQQWPYEAPLLACRVAPDGETCVSSSQDFTLQRWNIATGEKIIFKAHDSWVHSLCYSLDGNLLVTSGCDGRLIWWSIKDAEPKVIRSIDAHIGWVRGVEISRDGKTIISVGNDKMIRLWSVESGEKLSEWSAHERHIYSAAFHPNGQMIATGDLMGKIHLWNVSDHALIRTFDGSTLYSPNPGQGAEFGGIRSMSINAAGTELVACGTHKASNPYGAVHEPLLLRFKVDDGTLLKSHACEGIAGGMLFRTQHLDDDLAMAVSGGSSGGILLCFSSSQDKEVHRFGLPSLARDMDLHVGKQLVASAHYDNHLRVSRVES